MVKAILMKPKLVVMLRINAAARVFGCHGLFLYAAIHPHLIYLPVWGDEDGAA